MVEQGHENEQQQKTHHICSFPGDDEILGKKGEIERCNEEEKELLMRVVKEIRYHPERISLNLGYIDRKKVRAATMKGYKKKEMIGDRQPNWQRKISEKQKVLQKVLGQSNKMRQGKCKIKASYQSFKESLM